MDNNELTHHGIKGQKWGQRLYQNRDGTLTTLGKLRYGKSNSKSKSKSQEEPQKDSKKKTIKEMSDAELRNKIERLRLEKTYSELVRDISKLNTKPESKVKKMLGNILDKSVSSVGKDYSEYLIRSAINKVYGKEVVPSTAKSEKKKK